MKQTGAGSEKERSIPEYSVITEIFKSSQQHQKNDVTNIDMADGVSTVVKPYSPELEQTL